MKRLRWPLAIVAIIAGIVWHSSLHVSPGPAFGTHLDGEAAIAPPAKPFTLRLGAFNIHGGKGRNGRRDLGRVADQLRGLDFVALSEVLGRSLFGSPDQAEQLGRELGVQWLFAPADGRWYGQESGNGVLSRLPVISWQRLPLPRQFDRGYRNMVLVDVELRPKERETRKLHLLLTHVNRRCGAERKAQLAAVIGLFLSLAEPAVLLGDLNSDANDPQIRELLAMPGVVDAVGERLGDKAPANRIDWIIARGLRCSDAGIRDNGASDHPLIWAELALPD